MHSKIFALKIFILGYVICSLPLSLHSQNWNIATGGNVLHNGLSKEFGPPTPTLLWSGGLTSQIAFAPVTDSIYLATVRMHNISDPLHGNKIVMYDIRNGDTLWTKDLPVNFPLTDWSNRVSAIDNGVLYASRSGNSNEAYIYALDAQTGTILWQSDSLIGESINEGANFTANGDLLIGNLFSITRISKVDGSTVWQTNRLGYQNGAELAVYGTKVYSIIDIANAVCVAAYDMATGQLLYMSAALAGGLVQQLGFFIGNDGTIYVPRSQNNPTTDSLFSLTDNGSAFIRNWAVPIDYIPFSSHATGPDGSVYGYNRNGRVMRINPLNGSVIDTSKIVLYGDAFQPRMSIDSAGRVFVTNGGFNDGMFYSFNADLTLRWEEVVPNVNVGGPAIGLDGTLIVCGIGTDLRAYRGEFWTSVNENIETGNPHPVIFPNPAISTLNITGLMEETNVNVFDMSGKLLLTGSLDKGLNKLNITNLTNGVYILQMKNSGGLNSERFVKQ